MDALRIYDYLTKARERVFDSVRALAPAQYAHEFRFGLNTFGRTLTHIMISEWYYIERIEERTVPHYDAWPIKDETPPAFEVIERSWREQAKSTRASIAGQRDWSRTISWIGFPDDQGRRFQISCTAGDLVTQLALHEVHHRAQVMAMIKELRSTDERRPPNLETEGAAPAPLEDLDFNSMMFDRREVTS